MRHGVVREGLDHLAADLQLVLGLGGQRDRGVTTGDGEDLGGGKGGRSDAHGLRHTDHVTPAPTPRTMPLSAKSSGIRLDIRGPWAEWRNRSRDRSSYMSSPPLTEITEPVM